MNPYGIPATPATPARGPSIEELRQALRLSDTKLSDLRTTLDGHARGRRYREAAATAKEIGTVAEAALKHQQALDAAMVEAQKKR